MPIYPGLAIYHRIGLQIKINTCFAFIEPSQPTNGQKIDWSRAARAPKQTAINRKVLNWKEKLNLLFLPPLLLIQWCCWLLLGGRWIFGWTTSKTHRQSSLSFIARNIARHWNFLSSLDFEFLFQVRAICTHWMLLIFIRTDQSAVLFTLVRLAPHY